MKHHIVNLVNTGPSHKSLDLTGVHANELSLALNTRDLKQTDDISCGIALLFRDLDERLLESGKVRLSNLVDGLCLDTGVLEALRDRKAWVFLVDLCSPIDTANDPLIECQELI